MHHIPISIVFSVNRHNHALTPKLQCQLIDQAGPADGRRIDGYLVCPCVEQSAYILHGGDPPSNRKWYIDLPGYISYKFYQGLPVLHRGRDIQEDQLIRPLFRINRPLFHSVSRIAQFHEVYTFHRSSILDVKTRDYSFCKHLIKFIFFITHAYQVLGTRF
jgi:hypothetical protein